MDGDLYRVIGNPPFCKKHLIVKWQQSYRNARVPKEYQYKKVSIPPVENGTMGKAVLEPGLYLASSSYAPPHWKRLLMQKSLSEFQLRWGYIVNLSGHYPCFEILLISYIDDVERAKEIAIEEILKPDTRFYKL